MRSVREEAEADLCTGIAGNRPRGIGTAADCNLLFSGSSEDLPRLGSITFTRGRTAAGWSISPASFSFSLSSTGDSSAHKRLVSIGKVEG